MKTLLLFSLFAFARLASAATTTPLFFPAQKNHVDVLAQHFLYGLEDPHHLRVGDVMIDDRKIRFAASQGRDVRLTFQWQAAVLTEGRLSLLDSTGKAIWTQDFEARRLNYVKDPTATGDLRTDLARLTSEVIPPAIWTRVRSLPFINFCVSKEQPDAKFYLCSGTFYIEEKKDGTRAVLPRFAGKKDAFVEINGSAATPQGTVYLNDPKQSLFMRGQLESGASVELLTHRGNIDFKDAVESDDGANLLITSHGAEPVNKSAATKNEDGDFQVSLPKDRPAYYLTGEGGVPMRQEFSVTGALPKGADRPRLEGRHLTETYGSSVSFTGVAPDGVTINGTSDAPTQDLGRNRFSWTLRDLPANAEIQRRYLSVTKGNDQFAAAFDVRRGKSHEVDLKLLTRWSNLFVHGELAYRQWMEQLLWLPGDWSRFHWGWAIADRIHLKTPADGPAIDQLTAELLFRSRAGFPYEEPTWTAGLLFGQMTVNSDKSTAIGLDLGYEAPPPATKYPWLAGKVDWLGANLRFWPSSSGSDAKLATSWEASVQASKRLSPSAFARLSAGLSQYKTSLATTKEGPQLDLGLSYGLNF